MNDQDYMELVARTAEASDPFLFVIEEEDAREVDQWTERIIRAGTEPRSWTAQKRAMKELLDWEAAEPETRREVAKDVIRSLNHSIDAFGLLWAVKAESMAKLVARRN